MKKNLVCVLCILMLTTLLVACGSKKEEPKVEINNDPSILGTWTEDYFDSGYTFNEDGTGIEIFYDQAFTYIANDGLLTIHYEQTDVPYADKEFTYSVNDTELTLEKDSQSFTYNKAQ